MYFILNILLMDVCVWEEGEMKGVLNIKSVAFRVVTG